MSEKGTPPSKPDSGSKPQGSIKENTLPTYQAPPPPPPPATQQSTTSGGSDS